MTCLGFGFLSNFKQHMYICPAGNHKNKQCSSLFSLKPCPKLSSGAQRPHNKFLNILLSVILTKQFSSCMCSRKCLVQTRVTSPSPRGLHTQRVRAGEDEDRPSEEVHDPVRKSTELAKQLPIHGPTPGASAVNSDSNFCLTTMSLS